MKASVIGTGTWGTTLAILLSRKSLAVTLWTRTSNEAERLQCERENKALLPGVAFPATLRATASLGEALPGADLVLLVVPSQSMRENVRRIKEYVPQGAMIASAAKGLEIGTLKRMSEVMAEELPEIPAGRFAVISGPNLAREIAAGKPAATVVASASLETASAVRDALMSPLFRVYTSDDVVGVELGGALKNIIALGAGMGDGLSVGDNAKAAFMTRGLAEITRLGVAMGANPLTFAGLAGLGDLVATCASRQSRNRFVGEELGRGRGLVEVQGSMRMVAEGVPTTRAAYELARRYDVEMPIARAMYEVLFANKEPRAAVMELMAREPRGELA